MKKIKVRTKTSYRYNERMDDFTETTIRLLGNALLGAVLTLAGVLLSDNTESVVKGLFSDLVMTLGCVILVLSVCLLLGYMFVMTLGKSDKHRKDYNDEI